MSDPEIIPPIDILNRLSVALIQIGRGDPIIALRAELDTRFESLQVRFNAIDKATELQHEDLTRVPTQVDRAVSSLRELFEQELQTLRAEVLEKFNGVGAQFTERDTRTDQRAGDTKLAVDAAFAAAKEATAKIEAGFTKQIDGMVELVDTKTSMLTQQIGDLKDRVISMESGGRGQTQGMSTVGVVIVGGAVVLATVISFVALTFSILHHGA